MLNVILCLEDGSRFTGRAVTPAHTAGGEIVFNTSMTGYQEICTDPSYSGQMIVMTYPHIGNVGVNPEDLESEKPQLAAMICRSYHDTPSNWRATESLHNYLERHGIPLLTDVDTRQLVRHLRDKGAMRAVILPAAASAAEVNAAFAKIPEMEGQDLASKVSCKESYEWAEKLSPLLCKEGPGEVEHTCSTPPSRYAGDLPLQRGGKMSPHIIVLDFGVKFNILRHLVARGCAVTVVPSRTTTAEVLKFKPAGVLLSNGPGDPAAVSYAPALINALLGKVPIFGICLGHQLLALALGARSYKLKFGHRGANQPVKNLITGKVTITSQNHGFAIDAKTLPADCEETEINLNDGTNQGFRHKKLPIIAVQYHPEASPGPHDANFWFDIFVKSVQEFPPPLRGGGWGEGEN